MISPEETLVYYEELLNYISEKTGRPVELGKGTTFLFTIPKASDKQMSFDEFNYTTPQV